MDKPLFKQTRAESKAHKIIKNFLLKILLKYSKNIKKGSLEKKFKNRRADIYLELKSGKRVVIEVQNSKLSVKDAITRTKDYNRKGIYVLWILNANGECVGEERYPTQRKNVRVSPLELFLQKIYGGRTYYVKISPQNNKITTPYAIHFSLPDKKSPLLKKYGFEYFYVRNSHCIKMKNLELFCIDYGLKIARFYDKNFEKIVLEDVNSFLKKKLTQKCENCRRRFRRFRGCKMNKKCNFKPFSKKKLIKLCKKEFEKKYGISLVNNSIKQSLI